MGRGSLQGTGFACVLIGYAALGGVIANGSGWTGAVAMLLIGVVILCLTSKEERKSDEKEDNSNPAGSSPGVSVDRLREGK
jgi:hypothetical protein